MEYIQISRNINQPQGALPRNNSISTEFNQLSNFPDKFISLKIDLIYSTNHSTSKIEFNVFCKNK
jgi:hypothetical protein